MPDNKLDDIFEALISDRLIYFTAMCHISKRLNLVAMTKAQLWPLLSIFLGAQAFHTTPWQPA